MSAADPWLSVVMPVYNGEAYLRGALDGVLAGEAAGIEIIACDDGSTDASVDVLRSYAARLAIRILPRPHDGNWVAGTNAGLRIARGRYACLLHQDDAWLPGRLAAIRRELERTPATLLVHDACFVGPGGERLGAWRCPLPRRRVVDQALFVERLLVQNFVAIPSPVFDRAAALAGGGMDEALWYTADWDLWLRLGRMGPVRFIPVSLAAFRVHPKSQTVARPRARDEIRRQMEIVLDRHLAAWEGRGVHRRRVEAVARFSVQMNAALEGAARGERVRWWALARHALGLGPLGLARYLRDSRIVERVGARMRLARMLR